MTPPPAPGRSGPAPYACRHYAPGDETAIVELLNAAFSGGWGDVARWRRRHIERPHFLLEDVWLASDGERLVGCLHTAVHQITLGEGIRVPVGLDGDLALRPELSGRGIPEALYAASEEALRRRGVVLRLGWSEAATRVHFYTRVLGYITGFDPTRALKKQLDPAPIRERLLAALGGPASAADAGRGPILELHLTGLPPVRVRLAPGGATPARDGPPATLVVTSDQRLLTRLAGHGWRAVLEAWRRDALALDFGPAGGLAVAFWFLRHRPGRAQRSR